MFFLGWGSQNSKFSQFQMFPKLGQILNFSQIQNSPKHPGGGGVEENYGFFPLFWTSFNSPASLIISIFSKNYEKKISYGPLNIFTSMGPSGVGVKLRCGGTNTPRQDRVKPVCIYFYYTKYI